MLFKRRAVRLALKKLAQGTEDAHVIAQRLKEAGVRGDSSPLHCPVANYLRQETGVRVRVNQETITNDWVGPAISTPSVVAVFIDMFDSDCFPELQPYSQVDSP